MSLSSSFIQRTLGGARALQSSVELSGSSPLRAVFFAAGAVRVAGSLHGRPLVRALGTIVAPLALAGELVYGAQVRPSETHAPSTSNATNHQQHHRDLALAGAVMAGAVGSMAQLRSPRAKPRTSPRTMLRTKPQTTPWAGMLAIAAQHCLYSFLLRRAGAQPRPVELIPRTGAWLAGIALSAWRAPQLLWPSLFAGAAVASTSALAQDPLVGRGTVQAQGVSHGGNLLLAGEGLVLLQECVRPSKSILRLNHALQAALFLVGTVLLIDGLRSLPLDMNTNNANEQHLRG